MAENLMTLTEAAALTARFRSQNQSITGSIAGQADFLPICETFSKQAFDTLFADGSITQVRIYLGMDINDKVRLIVCGANRNGEDVYISGTNPANDLGEDSVIEDGIRCPTICPPPSPLNS